MKTKKRLTKKRKNKIAIIKTIIILTALTAAAATIGVYGQIAEKEADASILTLIGAKMAIVGAKEVSVWPEEELTVKEQITYIALKRNFKQIDRLLQVIDCESKFNPYAINVNKSGSIDRGVAQWNNYYHSKMTDEQAFSVEYSVNKMMDYWEQGKENLWACTKIVAKN